MPPSYLHALTEELNIAIPLRIGQTLANSNLTFNVTLCIQSNGLATLQLVAKTNVSQSNGIDDHLDRLWNYAEGACVSKDSGDMQCRGVNMFCAQRLNLYLFPETGQQDAKTQPGWWACYQGRSFNPSLLNITHRTGRSEATVSSILPINFWFVEEMLYTCEIWHQFSIKNMYKQNITILRYC